MPAFTPTLNLYKPGGGSTGVITPDEVADIDRLNQNFDLIDTWAAGVNQDLTGLKGGWQLATLNSGWVAAPAGAVYYRILPGGDIEFSPFEIQRDGSGLSISSGAQIQVANLAAIPAPAATTLIGVGSIGVAGNLGTSKWFVNSSKILLFQSFVATGTMAAGGGTSNHAANGPGRLHYPS